MQLRIWCGVWWVHQAAVHWVGRQSSHVEQVSVSFDKKNNRNEYTWWMHPLVHVQRRTSAGYMAWTSQGIGRSDTQSVGDINWVLTWLANTWLRVWLSSGVPWFMKVFGPCHWFDLGVLVFIKAFGPSCCCGWLYLGASGFIKTLRPLLAQLGHFRVHRDVRAFVVLWLDWCGCFRVSQNIEAHVFDDVMIQLLMLMPSLHDWCAILLVATGPTVCTWCGKGWWWGVWGHEFNKIWWPVNLM